MLLSSGDCMSWALLAEVQLASLAGENLVTVVSLPEERVATWPHLLRPKGSSFCSVVGIWDFSPVIF